MKVVEDVPSSLRMQEKINGTTSLIQFERLSSLRVSRKYSYEQSLWVGGEHGERGTG